MGLNLAGIAIDKNFSKNIEQLGEAFEWAIDIIDESEFGKSMSIFSSNDKDIFYVYFTDSGTLILNPYEWAIEEYHPTDAKSLCFAFSETTMNFFFSYQHQISKFRTFIEDEGKKTREMGEPLEIEKQFPEASQLIFKLIEDLIGTSFHSIGFNEFVHKCKRLSHQEYMRRSEEILQREMEIEKRKNDERTEKYMKELGLDPKKVEKLLSKKKKWWEIWK